MARSYIFTFKFPIVNHGYKKFSTFYLMINKHLNKSHINEIANLGIKRAINTISKKMTLIRKHKAYYLIKSDSLHIPRIT